MDKLKEISSRLKLAEGSLNNYLIERDEEINGLFLATISGANILLLGPPGIAKSFSIETFSKVFKDDMKVFKWLLTKFTVDAELFGNISPSQLDNDRYVRITTNKLPVSDLAILDEVFKGNSGILNALLYIMNERVFFNDGEAVKIPLLSLIGASNEIPDEGDGLDAMYDRFVLKYVVSPIREESGFLKMLALKDEFIPEAKISKEDIHYLRSLMPKVEVEDDVYKELGIIRDQLTKAGFTVTERTFKMGMSIIKAGALFNGRMKAEIEDIEILSNAFWKRPEDKAKVGSIILQRVNPTREKILNLYTMAEEAIAEYKNLATKSKKDTNFGATAIEVSTKLTEIREKMEAEISTLKKMGRPIVDIENKIKHIDQWRNDIFRTAISGK